MEIITTLAVRWALVTRWRYAARRGAVTKSGYGCAIIFFVRLRDACDPDGRRPKPVGRVAMLALGPSGDGGRGFAAKLAGLRESFLTR